MSATRIDPGIAAVTLWMVVAGSGCDLPTSTDPVPAQARPAHALQLLPGPLHAHLAALPIRVEAWANEGDDSAAFCVRLTSNPGPVDFPFPDSEDGGVVAQLDAGMRSTASAIVQHVIRTRADSDAGIGKGHLLARYVPHAADEVATIFGELIAHQDCSGKVLASTAIVIDFSARPSVPEHDEDAGADETDGGRKPQPPDEDAGGGHG